MTELYRTFMNSTGVSTDSRSIQPGQIFFALKGDFFDGHRFLGQVINAGVAGVVVQKNRQTKNLPENLLVFEVDDTLITLQELAQQYRKNFKGTCFAITGSNGKTTTKELIHAVLSKKFHVHATPGNLNNHIGLPLTILSMPANTDFLLLEMGANHQGEIAALCEIGMPEYGLVTNVAHAHLEGFGGLEGVIKAKGELYQYLCKHGKLALYDAKSPHLKNMIPCETKFAFQEIFNQYGVNVEVGTEGNNNNLLTVILKTNDERLKCNTQLTGIYNLQNVWAAISTGLLFDVPLTQIQHSLEHYHVKNMRSQIFKEGTNTIILDAYNANPTSMSAALENLKGFKGRKIAVLGDMLELGDEADKFHRDISEQALAIDQLTLVTVGPLFGKINTHESHQHFDNSEGAGNWLLGEKPENTTLLFKGSRGIGIEKTYERFKNKNPG